MNPTNALQQNASISDEAASSLLVLNFQDAVRIGTRLAFSRPRALNGLKRVLQAVERKESIRMAHVRNGLSVPPLMIVSLTRKCNLACAGCYSHEAAREAGQGCGVSAEMSEEAFSRLIGEAESLGISLFMLAGGEPLMRPELIKEAARHPDSLFLVFTNGWMIDAEASRFMAAHPNVVPVISTEGGPEETDARRGAGTHRRFVEACAMLRKERALSGTSITVTMENLELVTSDAWVDGMIARGLDLFFFVEYVPQGDSDRHLALDEASKLRLSQRAEELMHQKKRLLFAFPGDETVFGGCLASGRGFLHVAPDGALTPCPFAGMNDSNAVALGLEQALRSPLLALVREHHGELTETRGGCALAQHRGLVEEWMRESALV